MKYNQPYGVSDPNGAYINGNPSTGVMGSIPPAAAIEYPQREIANYVNISGLTPTNADLLQLAKAVQCGRVNYGVDGGVVNAIAVTPVVPVTAYTAGLRLCVKVSYGNTSQVTVNVSGIGNVPLIHSDLSPLLAYELVAGQLIEIAYDGSNFQMLAGGSNVQTVIMSQPQHLYCNASTGDDTLYDGTSPAPIGAHGGPFRTIEKALATMKKYNLGGWTFFIHLADGVYTSTEGVDFPLPNGSGMCSIIGNNSDPTAVSIFNIGKGSCFRMFQGGLFEINGCSFRSTSEWVGTDAGHGIWAMFGSIVRIGTNAWASVPAAHYTVGSGSTMHVFGNQTITGPAPYGHQFAYMNGIVLCGIGYTTDPNLTVTAPVTMGPFCSSSGGGLIWSMWNSMSGKANVTGPRYQAYGNGVIDTHGRGATALPGTVAGTVSSGGQYI